MRKADVLIVGGGLVGCATAWHLARGGAQVTLLEAGDIGMGASGQNAGSLHFQLERRFLENGEALAEQAARTAALSRLAIDDWRGLEAELGADLHVVMDGGLMVAETAEQVGVLERKIARENAEGLATRLLDGDEARAIAPYLSAGILAAGFSGDEGHADARAVTRAFAEAAAHAGAILRMRSPVTSARRLDRGFEIACADETLQGDRLVIACGAWTAQICARLNLHMPLFPVALLMNATERTAKGLRHLVQHVGRRLSMKQTHAGNILIGGGWPARLAQAPDGTFDPRRRPEMIAASLAGNMRAAIDTAPFVAKLNLIRSWTGVTAISADQLPIVGEVPSMPGCWVAGGGSAFTLGPTFARLMAQAMGGRAAPELDIVSPARFEHLNSFMG
ncbi:FAD-dependent oxidoreductase [Novosphingobium sp. PC22D]|uniref:NAD(P)/FAD-dependent oxidoreductase n=1 Tax=Novosphingobium sp. PC22D TaxID=1962403 RepID=UPI000BEFD3F2|nr:FAD-dependent oxidoreductase [Novosphingobium sp. PC22D]PEQ13583.1 FAD-dependent oxidoreductase [Novosphingobium sp. PC22D]